MTRPRHRHRLPPRARRRNYSKPVIGLFSTALALWLGLSAPSVSPVAPAAAPAAQQVSTEPVDPAADPLLQVRGAHLHADGSGPGPGHAAGRR